MKQSNWIDGKVVVITGASSGMGKDIATRLIKEHNCTVIGIARNEAKMQTLVAELGSLAHHLRYQLFDVSIKENWTNLAQNLLEEECAVDVLINNAGILPRFDRFDHYSSDEIEAVMGINFFSSVYAMHALLPILLKSNTPAIINVDSSAALMSLAGTSVYSASKAALKSMTESIREELRGKCYVGLVCPGFTKTDIFCNQTADGGEKALDFISTPCDKMVTKIMGGLAHKKHLMVYGKDAIFMDMFGRLMPVEGAHLFSWVLKKSKLPLFDAIFKN